MGATILRPLTTGPSLLRAVTKGELGEAGIWFLLPVLLRDIQVKMGIRPDNVALGSGEVIGLSLGPNIVIANVAKNLYLLLLCQICDINIMSRKNALAQNRRNSLPCTELPDKSRAIKELLVGNGWDLDPCLTVGH